MDMYTIQKIASHPTVDFAAEELKKYLRMMMPRCGEIPITYAPKAKEGYRLGLMEDFSLDTSEAKDLTLDDIIHIDTNEQGGIISGSNPRSVLLAVYRFLRENGCRWLFPGVDGEYIPTAAVKGVQYHKLADYRYRGQCNEGSEIQYNMIEAIDFTPKIGMNIFMLEFDNPFTYYNKFYSHATNPAMDPEPVTLETVLQWKRQCECEISKRGLQYHDMGHGWTVEPYGISSYRGWTKEETDLPDEKKKYLAMINGQRELFGGIPLNTNVCMSNPACRKIMADYIADYAETQNNVDFLHIWLADATNNHCECDECQKKTVSDWYVILLNDIDAEFPRRSLSSRLVFIVYVDTFWAPLEEKLINPARYTLLFAPIFRSYSETYGETPNPEKLTPFVRNKLGKPNGMGECLAYLNEWKKVYSGDCCCYEYHFWKNQYYDMGFQYLAKLLYDDVMALKQCGIQGIIQDGSQRSFFPNGFPFYVYGETLFDCTRSFEELEEDYFTHAYGANWKQAKAYLDSITAHCDYRYMSGTNSADLNRSMYYHPQVAEQFEKIPIITAAFRPVIKDNIRQPFRPQTVAWQLLQHHADYCDMLSTALAYKARGMDTECEQKAKEFYYEFGSREDRIQRYFDYFLSQRYLNMILSRKTRIVTTQ